MGKLYKCHNCDYEVVLVSGCGVAHELICNDCERQLYREGKRSTEFIGHESNTDDRYTLA